MTEGRDSLLERYFDGALSEDERREFERTAQESPELRAQIELQGRIEGALREIFADGVPEADAIPIGRGSPGELSWRRLMVYAAAVLLLAGAGVWVRHTISQRNSFNPINSPERIYTRLVQTGFEPEFVCEPGPEFVAAVEDRFGEGLDIEPPAGVEVIGWAYADPQAAGAYTGQILSPDMLILMAYVEKDPVIVLMDRIGADTRPRLAPQSELRMFRKRLEDFVLYEVTPHGQPRLLREFVGK